MALHDNEIIWAQRYRPRKVSDVILPKATKAFATGIIGTGEIPNMTLAGPAGVGKTTLALAMSDELGYDTLLINGSGQDRGIDAIKSKITSFATTCSLEGGRKLVIVDEADNLTHDAQLAFRGLIEAVSSNCTFILTCNYQNRINEALRSRCPVTHFQVPTNESQALQFEMFKRCKTILEENDVPFEPKALAKLVGMNFPDLRLTLGALQRAAASGRVDESVLRDATAADYDVIVKALKKNDVGVINKWVAESPIDPTSVMTWFGEDERRRDTFRSDKDYLNASFYAWEHMDSDARVADRQHNLRVFLFKVMQKCEVT